jgi:acetate---CoA ligase (ADP-forming) subunit beta
VVGTLSEIESKRLLAPFGVPFVEDRVAADAEEAVAAAEGLGYPVVAKLAGPGIAHKTERGLVRLGLTTADQVRAAAAELLDRAGPDDGDVAVLITPQLIGTRELLAGLARDPTFGMTVLLGIGGIVAEAVADVAVRLAPITTIDADEMIDDLASQPLLGEFRGDRPVDRRALADVLLGLSRAANAHAEIVSADLNPLIVVDGRPVAVDALVEVA